MQALFEAHCEELTDNSIDAPENWLKTGFNYFETKKSTGDQTNAISCPFCQQTIDDNLEIIKAYTLRFNEEFNLLISRLQTHLTALRAFNIDSAIQALNNVNETNSGRITTWTTHLPSTVQSPVFNIVTNEQTFREEFDCLLNAVQQKSQNPSSIIAVVPVTTFEALLNTVNENINTYNTSVTAFNRSINTFRSAIQTVPNAQLEVNKLKRIQKRFNTEISGICSQHATEKQNLRNLETSYRTLVQRQETEASTFFSSYKDRINHYLEIVFKTPFKIDNVAHVAPQGRATHSKISYKLTIDGHDISFDQSQANNAKDCLSEGDKSTIALAFFLSKLDIDPGKSNKILIFDDPLSSFDSNRRMYTVQLIKDLFSQIKQVIVLSHNEFFLYELLTSSHQPEYSEIDFSG